MTREKITRPAPREVTPEKTRDTPKDLTETGEQSKKSVNDTVDTIDKVLEENKVKQDDIDSLLDEIDSALDATLEGTTATEWVSAFVQKGGE